MSALSLASFKIASIRVWVLTEIKIFRFAKSDECFEALSEEAKQEESMNLRNGFNYGKVN